jgi:hypothetical protein
MRLLRTLVIALLVLLPALAGCSSSSSSGCGAPLPPDLVKQATEAQACAILQDPRTGDVWAGAGCDALCGTGYDACRLPAAYVTAATPPIAADAAVDLDAGNPCPTSFARVAVTCTVALCG